MVGVFVGNAVDVVGLMVILVVDGLAVTVGEAVG